jgi:hypothetical protein
MEKRQPVLCPSARCKGGAIVLGIVLPNRTIAYADRRFSIDARQAEEMRSGGLGAEERFRFASGCAACGCQQWSQDKCGVIEEVLAVPPPASLPRTLPACSIREQCRWFLQRGAEACSVCRYVITDTAVMTVREAAALSNSETDETCPHEGSVTHHAAAS